jgi:hypothetical protein
MATSSVVRHLKDIATDAFFFIEGYQGRSPCLVSLHLRSRMGLPIDFARPPQEEALKNRSF